MPEFYMIIARKKYFCRIFGGTCLTAPPVSYAYGSSPPSPPLPLADSLRPYVINLLPAFSALESVSPLGVACDG